MDIFPADSLHAGVILSAVHNWQSKLDGGTEIWVVYFDLLKVFGSYHPNLSLITLEIPIHLVAWISGYLYNQQLTAS